MNVNVPKGVCLVYDGNPIATMYHGGIPGIACRASLWIAYDNDLSLVKDETEPFFRETRRTDFSDVCHAKVLRPIKDLPEGGAWAKSTSSVWYRIGYSGEDLHYIPTKETGNRGSYNQAWAYVCTGLYGILIYLVAWTDLSWNVRYGCSIRTVIRNPNLRPDYYPTSRERRKECHMERCNVEYRCKYTKDGTPTVKYSSSGDTKLLSFAESVLATYSDNTETVHADKSGMLLGDCQYLLQLVRAYQFSRDWTSLSWSFASSGRYGVQWEFPKLTSAVFKLHEPEAIMNGVDDIVFGSGFEAYNRNALIQQAYLDALQNVPRLSDNSISNLLELIGFIKALVVERRIDIPKSLSDLWLQYRYVYKTTEMDVKQAISFVKRHIDLGNWKRMTTYGTSALSFDGVDFVARATMKVIPKQLPTVEKIWKALYTYGLSPSFYAVWDMIPFSFIADWFLPIGDVMAAWDAERVYTQYYDVKNIMFSISYSTEAEGIGLIRCYTRWLSTTPLPLRGYYQLESNGPSAKTFAYRVLDTASLILG